METVTNILRFCIHHLFSCRIKGRTLSPTTIVAFLPLPANKRGEHLLTRINRLISFTAQTHINAQLIPFVSFSILMDNIPKREPLLSFRINNLPFNTPFYYITRTGSAIIIEKVITVNPILRQIILFQQSSEFLFSEIVKFNVC